MEFFVMRLLTPSGDVSEIPSTPLFWMMLLEKVPLLPYWAHEPAARSSPSSPFGSGDPPAVTPTRLPLKETLSTPAIVSPLATLPEKLLPDIVIALPHC